MGDGWGGGGQVEGGGGHGCGGGRVGGKQWALGRRQNSHSRMTKTCWETFSNLFAKCMGQVTKGHLYHLLGVSDYYIMYRQRVQSVL